MVNSRSPLGYLRALRFLTFFLPLMSLLVLAMGGRRFNGAFVNPASLGEMRSLMLPLFAGTAIVVMIIGSSVKPETPIAGRYIAICLTYLMALVSFWFGVIYSLAGASALWGCAGFALAIFAVVRVSLNRLASDVSTQWY